ncbi:MAG: truB [Firmicutes bacterium]|nr:truB [Bacillota bacterium]
MISGIVNVLKPPGMTSHDVVSYIRRIYDIKRIGHAGTLDPAAAGVLPVFLGAATRLIEYTADADKTYQAEMTFGFATDSGDDTGKVTVLATDTPLPSLEELHSAMVSFSGPISQIPPMHSAIKVAGKKLYELARQGIAIERQPRNVVIKKIALLRFVSSKALFVVDCSKGTYIRTLCTDIGNKVGCPAVMSFLVRTRVGEFNLNEAKTLEEIAENKMAALLPFDIAIKHLSLAVLSDEDVKAFKNGRCVYYESHSLEQVFKVYDQAGSFVGIGEKKSSEPRLYPTKVLG